MQEQINQLKQQLEQLSNEFEAYKVQNSQLQNPIVMNDQSGVFGKIVDIVDVTGVFPTVSTTTERDKRTDAVAVGVSEQIFIDKATSQLPKATAGDGIQIYDAKNNAWRFIVFDL